MPPSRTAFAQPLILLLLILASLAPLANGAVDLGRSANPVTDSNTIQKNIINQLENPVLWSETIQNMKNKGISDFFEVGPGKVLKGLNQRIYPESTTINCDKLEHLDACAVL